MTEVEPSVKSEADILRSYLPVWESITGERPAIEGLVALDENKGPSRAWRIILKPTRAHEQYVGGAFFDWDDTIEPYTERKIKFWQDCVSLIPEADETARQQFLRACPSVNRAARILPVNGMHPEHYSPLLELVAITDLIDSVRRGQIPEILKNQTAELSDEGAEDLARDYLEQDIIPKMAGGVGVQTEGPEGKRKVYFIEKKNQSTSVDFQQKPVLVNEGVWTSYKKRMTESNIPTSESDHFDLPGNVRFVVVTFGEAGFQLEKVANGLETLRKSGKRLPDEIILFTRGRKNPIIEKVLEKYPGLKFIYVDDSPRQLEGVATIRGIVPVHAQRSKSRRSTEEVMGNIHQVNMEKTQMSEIVGLIL